MKEEVPGLLQGAPACYEYLLKKYGKKNMPLKKCTFVKIMSFNPIKCSFRPHGSSKARKWFTIESVEDWYQKSISDTM